MRFIICLVLCLAFTTSCLASETVAANSYYECADIAAKNVAPRYPVEALRDGVGGAVIIAVWLDKCGRAIKSEVIKSSGSKLLNAAALEAANQSIFKPANSAEELLLPIEVPYTFTADSKVRFEKAVWPASHKKAHFISDELPVQFDSVQAAFDSVIKQPHRLVSKQPVLDMRQLKNGNGDIWLFLADNSTYKFKVAARYQRTQAEQPTVSVQVSCDQSIKDCDEMKAGLLKSGLPPFAKSLNQ